MSVDPAALAADLMFLDLTDPVQVGDLRRRLAGLGGHAQAADALLATAPGEDPTVLLARLTALVDAWQAEAATAGLRPVDEHEHAQARQEFVARIPDVIADLAALVDRLARGEDVRPDLRRALHTLKGEAGALDLRGAAQVLHAAEDALAAPGAGAALAGPLRLALDATARLLEPGDGPEPDVAGVLAALAPPPVPPLGDVLVGTGRVARADVEAALAAQSLTPERRLGEILVEAGRLDPAGLSEALHAQRPLEPRPAVAAASVRVDAARVDSLYDAVGELVIAQDMLAGSPEVRRLGSRKVRSLLAQVERTTRAIQDLAFRLRLVPIKALFQRTARQARETARATGREVEVVLVGEDQELDRAVVDRLGEPLLHLVRNAVDHGIEPGEVRAAHGKPRAGRLTLAAIAQGGAFRIEVADDGTGLDRARILAVARSRGLDLPDGAPDDEVWSLLFEPGFSTAPVLTEVSGRGVGLDAVRLAVEGLRGQVRVATTPGAGTCFTIHLPPTLAIMDGLVVQVAGRDYLIPTLAVVATARLDAAGVTRVGTGGRLVAFQGRHLPLADLADLFGHDRPAPVPRPLVVVVEDGRRRCALEVDAVLGRQQIVLKEVGAGLPPVAGIGGATIAADGRPALVIDPASLISLALGTDRTLRRAS